MEFSEFLGDSVVPEHNSIPLNAAPNSGESWAKRLISQPTFAGRLGDRPLGPSFQFQGFLRGSSLGYPHRPDYCLYGKSLSQPIDREDYGSK
jgi:hypothetical protein